MKKMLLTRHGPVWPDNAAYKRLVRSTGVHERDVPEAPARSEGGHHAPNRSMGREDFGAQGRNRTTDTVIFSHVLYQLSYLGAAGRRGRGL